jgi:hypothetical protein
MQSIEIYLIGVGTLLLVLAFYLGKRQMDKNIRGGVGNEVTGIPHEKAVRLQTSLMRLLHELQTLSTDMTTDLEKKLSELKKLLRLADTTLEEGLRDADEEELSPDSENSAEDEKPPEPVPIKSEPAIKEDNTPTPLANRYSEIFRMAEEGFPIEEIARTMNMGKGEIQLILSLRQKD